jgi:hypothetical protein
MHDLAGDRRLLVDLVDYSPFTTEDVVTAGRIVEGASYELSRLSAR